MVLSHLVYINITWENEAVLSQILYQQLYLLVSQNANLIVIYNQKGIAHPQSFNCKQCKTCFKQAQVRVTSALDKQQCSNSIHHGGNIKESMIRGNETEFKDNSEQIYVITTTSGQFHLTSQSTSHDNCMDFSPQSPIVNDFMC